MFTHSGKKSSKTRLRRQEKPIKGFHQNPFFYFGLTSVVLLGLLFVSSDSLAQDNYVKTTNVIFSSNAFLNDTKNVASEDLFFSQNNELALETPDLIVQDNSLKAATTTSILTTQTLGYMFGGSSDIRNDVVEYTVQPGDTLQSIANHFGNLRKDTVAAANGLSLTAKLKEGDALFILPVDGELHEVKSGQTIGGIAQLYNAKPEDILAYTNNDAKLYVGQLLIVPIENYKIKTLPPKITPRSTYSSYASLPNGLFITPLLKFTISQRLHYFNAVDLATNCGDPVYAMASGDVEKATFDKRYGYYVVVKHENGSRTYSGHLSSMQVATGVHVTLGDQIGTVGRTGSQATGCHLHLGVYNGFANPYAGYPVGSRFVNGNLVH